MSAGVAHEALSYDDDPAVVALLAEMVDRTVRKGSHVLVCLPERLTDLLAPSTAAFGSSVAFGSMTARYGRPVDAVEQLWSFTRERLAAGASGILSIGELPSFPDDQLGGWLWYEASIAEVMHDVPLRATCLLDRRTMPAHLLDQMLAAHGPEHSIPLMPLVALPGGPPVLELRTTSPRAARELVESVHGLLPDTGATVALVVSELVTNAVRHAASTATVRVWTVDGSLVLSVGDDGPGIGDPVAALRPPDLPRRGAGLWLCHKMADAFSLSRGPSGGCDARARFDGAMSLAAA